MADIKPQGIGPQVPEKGTVLVPGKPDTTKLKTSPVAAAVNTENKDKPFPGAYYIPANWHTESREDDKMFAKNNVTGHIFEGTAKEFSAKLRGQ